MIDENIFDEDVRTGEESAGIKFIPLGWETSGTGTGTGGKNTGREKYPGGGGDRLSNGDDNSIGDLEPILEFVEIFKILFCEGENVF